MVPELAWPQHLGYYLPKHIYREYQAFIDPQKYSHSVPWPYETTIQYIGMASKNNPKIFLPQIIIIFDLDNHITSINHIEI